MCVRSHLRACVACILSRDLRRACSLRQIVSFLGAPLNENTVDFGKKDALSIFKPQPAGWLGR
jgi:hypothetical protein